MPNELDDFLKDIKETPEDPFEQSKPHEKEESTETVETEETTEEEKEEKPLPFHKDPKVARFVEKEVEKRLKDFKPIERVVTENTEDSDDITDVLTRIIGDDTPEKRAGVKDLRRVLIEREEKGAQRALEQLQNEKNEERQAEAEAQDELTRGFEEVEENFNVDLTSNTPQVRKERGEFVDFIKRIAPKDENGDVTQFPDLAESYQLFKDTRKPAQNNTRAKELASRGMARSTETTTTATNTDKSWDAVDKIFGKLSDK